LAVLSSRLYQEDIMPHETEIRDLIAVVERLNASGDSWGWPADEISRIALRRWTTYARRHPKAKRVCHVDRVLDLAKGLQAHFESDTPYTPLSDWYGLAEALAEAIP
jgi:hypothetical protein